MKKFTAMLCAAVMASAMTFSAFAAPSPSADVITTTEIPMTVDDEQVVVVAKTLTVSDPVDTAAVLTVVEKAVAPVVEEARSISADPEVVAKVEETVTEFFTLAVKGATTAEFKEFKEKCEIFEDKTKTEEGKIRVMNPDGTDAELIDGTPESVSDIFTLEMRKVSDGANAEGKGVVLKKTFEFRIPAVKLGVTKDDTLLNSVYKLEADEENGILLTESFVKAVVEDKDEDEELRAELPAQAIATEVHRVIPKP